MKIFAKALLVLAVILCLAAIWIPSSWLQLLLSGLLALFVGAAILGQKPRT
ncbi:hypothetical protein M1D89_20345 [Arthrobacter sp. D3-18]